MPSQPTHRIEITRSGKNAFPPSPIPRMKVDDTVQYFSTEGSVLITFKGRSPFRMDEAINSVVTDKDTLTVKRPGKFSCGCTLILRTGQRIGWEGPEPEINPGSGGEHVVV